MSCYKLPYNSKKTASDYSLKVIHSKASNDYYPYGKILREYVPGGGAERYLTTQHERDKETESTSNGTGLDNRGARLYDSDVARFLSLDPLAAKFPNWSDYNYVIGNPVYYIDPDGRSPGGHGDEPETKTLTLAGSAKWSFGSIGIRFTFYGIPIKLNYSFGSHEQELGASIFFRDNGTAGFEVKQTQRQVLEGSWSAEVGPLGEEKLETRETTLSYNSETGGNRNEEKVFTQKKSHSVSVENVEVNSTTIEGKVSGEVNAVLLGLGASLGVSLEQEPRTSSTSSSSTSTSSTSSSTNNNIFISPSIINTRQSSTSLSTEWLNF